MSMVFFIDESGQDQRHREAYEIIGGIAVPQKELWPFVCAIRETIFDHFGIRELAAQNEIKGTSLLTNKRLKQAFGKEIPIDQRRQLVQEFFDINRWNKNHKNHEDQQRQFRRYHIDAFSQSCRFFCRDVLLLCRKHYAHVLAAVIDPKASRLIEDQLRSDYAGIFYKLYEHSSDDIERRSMVVHDERDDSQCRKLAQQLYIYYVNEGKKVAERVIPEPMFVKSHLTLGVLVADIVAYVLSWGFRHAQVLEEPLRPILSEFAELIREINQIPTDMPDDLEHYGILYIKDLADLEQWSKKLATD